MKISTKWHLNLSSEEDRKRFHDQYKNYLDEPIFKQLADILRQRIKELDRPPDYDNPSWSHAQAHRNGQKEAMKEILAILPISENL